MVSTGCACAEEDLHPTAHPRLTTSVSLLLSYLVLLKSAPAIIAHVPVSKSVLVIKDSGIS